MMLTLEMWSKQTKWKTTLFNFLKINVLFNDVLNTFLINSYIGVGNILIWKMPSGYLTGIDLRSTACQTGAYTSRLSRCPLFNKTNHYNIQIFDNIIFFKYRTRQVKATKTNK